MSTEAWQTLIAAALIIANGIVSYYHREHIKHEIRRMPAMQFDIAIEIDPTGHREPVIKVRRSGAVD